MNCIFILHRERIGLAVIGSATLGPVGGALERTEVSSIVGATFGGKAEATFVMLLEGRR